MDPTGATLTLRPVVDHDTLAELRELPSDRGGDALSELIDLYCQTAPELLQALRKAIAENDTAALARGAHRLKGASSAFGADSLCELCRRLESLGASGNLAAAADCVAAAEAELHRVFAALELSRPPGVA